MGDKNIDVSFSEDERSALHSLAEIFHDRDDRDKVRKLINEGATITQIVQAYRTQRGMIYAVKTLAGLIVVVGGAVAVLKGLGFWPAK